MKKIIILSLATALALAAAVSAPGMWEDSLTQVSVISADVVKHTDSVCASGEIVADAAGDMTVSVLISENDISKVKVGQEAVITGNAFPDREYTGKVKSIAPTAVKYTSGTVSATAVQTIINLEDCDKDIRAGYTAKAEIFTSEPSSIAVLPYEAIKADSEGNEYVFVYENGTAVRRDVVTGLETGDGVEIVSGLSSEDRVILAMGEPENGEFVVIKEKE